MDDLVSIPEWKEPLAHALHRNCVSSRAFSFTSTSTLHINYPLHFSSYLMYKGRKYPVWLFGSSQSSVSQFGSVSTLADLVLAADLVLVPTTRTAAAAVLLLTSLPTQKTSHTIPRTSIPGLFQPKRPRAGSSSSSQAS